MQLFLCTKKIQYVRRTKSGGKLLINSFKKHTCKKFSEKFYDIEKIL
jgi:hypothetical protein